MGSPWSGGTDDLPPTPSIVEEASLEPPTELIGVAPNWGPQESVADSGLRKLKELLNPL